MTKTSRDVSQAALLAAFVVDVQPLIDPIVWRINADRRKSIHFTDADLVTVSYDVTFVETLTSGGLMYHFIVRFGGYLHWDRLTELYEGLDGFCTYEEPPRIVDDLPFELGDGDDGGAVSIINGEFRIWLRHLPE